MALTDLSERTGQGMGGTVQRVGSGLNTFDRPVQEDRQGVEGNQSRGVAAASMAVTNLDREKGRWWEVVSDGVYRYFHGYDRPGREDRAGDWQLWV